MPVPTAFTVNGQLSKSNAPPETPLLWVIREELRLTGTKFGCGAGFCGACMVHVDGKRAFSCKIKLKNVAGKSLTTIEGLSADSSHPLQKAWLAAQVPQCGYCQSGQLMSAADLLKQYSKPSREQIMNHMQTNLCRCGTYQRIIRAIELAATEELTTAFVAGAATFSTESRGRAFGPWVSIAPDGTITIMSPAAEMGQGSMTSLPLIVAEEMDADWSKVRIEPAPPIDSIFGNPRYGFLYTAGSNAIQNYFAPLRIIGAQVRRVLMDNAARELGVPVEELGTEPSLVVHRPSSRKLTYGEIARFAEIPEPLPEVKLDQLKKPSQFRLITKDVMPVDLPSKVNGSARYSIDVQLPEMLYGAVLRAPVEGSVPDKIDDRAVRKIANVIMVVRMPWGVGVLAQTPWTAFEARRALAEYVTWSRTGAAWSCNIDEVVKRFSDDVRLRPADQATEWHRVGSAREEIKNAFTTMNAEYRSDYAYHAQMEPLNAVASVSPHDGSVEIWSGTQSQSLACESAAKILGITRDKIKLNPMLLGGGFGRRGHRDAEFILDAVWLSKEAGLPVKVMWTREDDMRNARLRPFSAHYLTAGLDPTGKLVAWHHRIAADRATPFVDPDRYQHNGGKDSIVMKGSELPGYAVPHILVEQMYRETGVRTSPLRATGYNPNKFATEAFLDEIACEQGLDPLTFHLELLKISPRAKRVVQQVARMAEWGRKREGSGLGLAYLEFNSSLVAGIAEVSLDCGTGRIMVPNFWAAIDCGIPVQPENIAIQLESGIVYGIGLALSETITIKDGVPQQSNFDTYHVPRMIDVPNTHVEIVATDNPPSGVGQMGTPLVAPAIANAFAQLTGARLRHTPFTPERVKDAMKTVVAPRRLTRHD
jgi:isoquinoline 1-oxidoreductase beta subunit